MNAVLNSQALGGSPFWVQSVMVPSTLAFKGTRQAASMDGVSHHIIVEWDHVTYYRLEAKRTNSHAVHPRRLTAGQGLELHRSTSKERRTLPED